MADFVTYVYADGSDLEGGVGLDGEEDLLEQCP